LDVVATRFVGTRVDVLLGDGHGGFRPTGSYRMVSELQSVSLADLDGDRRLDLLAASNGGRPAVRAGHGDGTFGPAQQIHWQAFGPFSITDLNHDRRPDVAGVGADHGDVFASAVLNWTGLPAPPCVIPPVIRLLVSRAADELDRAGCQVAPLQYQASPDIPKGRVIAQDPTSGAVLPNQSPVNLVVSLGR
jgi:hypothetical protein